MTPQLIVPRAGALNGFFTGQFTDQPQRAANDIDWIGNLDRYAQRLSEAQKTRYDQLKAGGTRIAYWRSDIEGLPCNGGSRDEGAAALRMTEIEEVQGPLLMCTETALHASLRPPLYKGCRLWIVAMHGEVVGSDIKFASLRREIIGEAIEIADPGTVIVSAQ